VRVPPSEKPTPSQPPSEPKNSSRPLPSAQSSLSSGRLTDAAADALLGADRPARLQMIAALVLGLVLVAIPLYLWRRPRSEAVTVASDATGTPALSASAVSAGGGGAGGGGVNGSSAGLGGATNANLVLLSETRVLECHDPGRTKTAATDCDHLSAIEKSFAQSIQSSASCLPTAAGGGTLVYVLDVSFQRRRNPIALTVPKDGRALRNFSGGSSGASSAAAACGSAVKHALSGVTLDGVAHAHARYKIAITATYNGAR
jgi:hypothetical protein